MGYPLSSTKYQLNFAVNKANSDIKKAMSKREYGLFNIMLRGVLRGENSINHNSINGSLTTQRKTYHRKILNETFHDRKTIDRNDPDLYILGGVAASGKTSTLSKKIPERAVKIDSDNYKAELSKKSQSPLLRFPLAHSGYLHEEADILVKEAISKSIREKRNTILDMTFANYEKGKSLIDRYKQAGYDIHLFGTQLAPHIAIKRATKRFLSEEDHRYVPSEAIALKGNDTNKNVMNARHIVDTYYVVDTTDYPHGKVVSESKKGLKSDFREPISK